MFSVQRLPVPDWHIFLHTRYHRLRSDEPPRPENGARRDSDQHGQRVEQVEERIRAEAAKDAERLVVAFDRELNDTVNRADLEVGLKLATNWTEERAYNDGET